jgi:predicted enzyme related to lactoylglutathione lyase
MNGMEPLLVRRNEMANTLNWFEIPTTDLCRATAFYEQVLGTSLKREDFGGTPMSIFATRDPDMAGALVKDARRKPSSDGALVYLNVNGQLDAVVARIALAGGEILLPKMDIGEPGFIALFRDTEGNVVGLHSERAR